MSSQEFVDQEKMHSPLPRMKAEEEWRAKLRRAREAVMKTPEYLTVLKILGEGKGRYY